MQRTPAPSVSSKWLALGAVAVLLGLVLRTGWVTEDAYITLRTVDNWVHGYGLRWNVDERVQSYTHPLWMLLLSVGYFVTRESFVTTVLIGCLTTAAAAVTLVHFARTAGHALAAIVLLTVSHGFIEFSTSGLENPLSHLLIAVFIGLYAMRTVPLWQLALTAALLMCNRIDAILVVAPALAHATWLAYRAVGAKQTARALALGFSPFLAWELFSLFYYGFPFPNTAYAKLNTGLPRIELLRQGVVYWIDTLAWDLPLHAVALAGAAVAFLQRRRRDVLIALGLLLYTLYVINIGGDFMHGRFWTIPFFTGVCLIAISELPLGDPLAAGAVTLPLAFFMVHVLAKESFAREYYASGIADERMIYRDDASLVLTSRTRPMPTHGWGALGNDVRNKGEKIAVHENVGFFGFAAGPQVHIIDPLALTEPLLARLPMRYEKSWRVGHYARRLPAHYFETIASDDGACMMSDPRLCEYYLHLREVISGPLFSLSRIKTLIAMNLGAYDGLIDRERYRFAELARASLQTVSEPVPEGAHWDADGTIHVAPSGLTIELPAPSKARYFEAKFDGNDSYVFEFRRDRRLIAKFYSPAFEAGLMRTRKVEIPAEAQKQGFDRIVVRPSGGDGMYSIADVRLLDQ